MDSLRNARTEITKQNFVRLKKQRLKQVVIKNFLYRFRFALVTFLLLGAYILFHEQVMNLYHCPFHSITGLYCPGCGGLRAVDSLLKFDFTNALRYNPLVVAFIPLFLLGLNRSIREKFLKAELLKIKFPLVLLCLVICFGILRNIFPL